jgi:hypothetical protein
LLQQQNKATAITKKQSAMRDATSEKKTNATKKNTCCNIKTTLLQQHKQSAMRDTTSEKKTNATKKNTCCNSKTTLLQQSSPKP